MSDSTVTYRATIYPWHCDHMGHMNVMWYVGKFDEGSWHLLSSLGLKRARFEREGAGMAAVEQHIDYKRELYAGDIVTIRSEVLEVKDKAIRLIHKETMRPARWPRSLLLSAFISTRLPEGRVHCHRMSVSAHS